MLPVIGKLCGLLGRKGLGQAVEQAEIVRVCRFRCRCKSTAVLLVVQNGFALRPCAADDIAYPLLYGVRVDRLDQKVSRTLFQTMQDIIPVGIRRDEDDRQFGGQRIGLQAVQQGKACPAASQADIDQGRTDPIGLLVDEGERLCGFLETLDVEQPLKNFI